MGQSKRAVIFVDSFEEMQAPLAAPSPSASPKADTLGTSPTLDTEAASTASGNSETAQLRDEVARLRRENQRHLRELDQLRAGAKTALNELDTQQLANAFARQAAHLVSADRALIGLNQNDTIVIRAIYVNGQLEQAPDLRFELGQGLAGSVALRRQAQIHNSIDDGPTLMQGYAADGMRFRNALCAPMLNHQGNVIGIIELHNKRDGGLFTRSDEECIAILATQAALGFERAQMFDRMTEWAQSIETLLSFNAAINEHLNPQRLVRRLVENAARFLKADGGMAGLAVRGQDGNTVMVADAYWHSGQWHDYPRIWLQDEGLPGFMLVSEFPYVTTNYVDDRLADKELIGRFDVKQALCVPIKDSEDHVVGFFKLHKNTLQKPFTWQDAAFLESLANTTAVAIRNAQLLKELEIKNHQIQALSADHLTRLEDERRHIARELHDQAGQTLIGLKLGLQVLSRKLTQRAPELSNELDDLREQVNGSTAMIKDLARQLRPPTLDELGLTVALKQLLSDYGQRTGLDVHLELHEQEQRLPHMLETALFRITQEALTNVAKHAHATQVWVSLLIEGNEMRLMVMDDGIGFDVHERQGGLGLLGMKERATLLGGKLFIDSREGEGTQTTVTIPIPQSTTQSTAPSMTQATTQAAIGGPDV